MQDSIPNGISKQLAQKPTILRPVRADVPEIVHRSPGDIAVLVNGVDFHPPAPPVGVARGEFELGAEMLGRVIALDGSEEAQRRAFVVLVRVPVHIERVYARDDVVGEVTGDVRWELADFHVDDEGVVWEVLISSFEHGARLVVQSLAGHGESFTWWLCGSVELYAAVSVCFDREDECVYLVAEFGGESCEQQTGVLRVDWSRRTDHGCCLLVETEVILSDRERSKWSTLTSGGVEESHPSVVDILS